MIKNKPLGKKVQLSMLALVLGLLLVATSIFGFMMVKVLNTLASSNKDLNDTIGQKSSAYMTEASQNRMLELENESKR